MNIPPDLNQRVAALEAQQNVHPIIRELFKTLPEPGEDWPLYARVAFLEACAATFNVVYEKATKINVVPSNDRREF
jgi:hypothetical protein